MSEVSLETTGSRAVSTAWTVVKLPEVVFFQEGPGLRKWQWTDHGMKVINVTNILADGRIDTANTSRFISLEEFDQKYRHIPVLMVTARSRREDMEMGLAVGADGYITKPFDGRALLTKVEELLAARAPSSHG